MTVLPLRVSEKVCVPVPIGALTWVIPAGTSMEAEFEPDLRQIEFSLFVMVYFAATHCITTVPGELVIAITKTESSSYSYPVGSGTASLQLASLGLGR